MHAINNYLLKMDFMAGNNSKMLYLFTTPNVPEEGRSVVVAGLCPMSPSSLEHSCPGTCGHRLVAGLTVGMILWLSWTIHRPFVNDEEAASSVPS